MSALRLLGRHRRGRLTVGQAYHLHFRGDRQERMFLSSLSFFGTFALVRAITHAIKNKVPPFHNISVGGSHIHHMAYGIALLLATGYAWLAQVGVGSSATRASRLSALVYGTGAALTLDEFALWLNLDEDDYWNKQGRKSVDAVVLFGGLLSAGFWGRSFLQAVLKRRPRRGRRV